MSAFLFFIFQIAVLIFSVVIHEVAHGTIANYLGDPTAKYQGRLTLNPLKHLDLFGSIILPLLLVTVGSPFVIGWAKPVPVNPYNFRDQKWGSAKVSAAGPGANILTALFFGIFSRFLPLSEVVKNAITVSFLTRNLDNLFYLIQDSFAAKMFVIFGMAVFFNLLLAVFNSVPIPPLDGSHILFSLLPQRLEAVEVFLKRYSLFILLIFIFFIMQFILPIVFFLYQFIVLGP